MKRYTYLYELYHLSKEARHNGRDSEFVDFDEILRYIHHLKATDLKGYADILTELNIWLHCGSHFFILEAVKILYALDIRDSMDEVDWIMKKTLQFDHSRDAGKLVDEILLILKDWRARV